MSFLPSLTIAAMLLSAASPVAMVAADKAFFAETEAEMSKMMTGMNVKPSGDVDQDFVAMMEPHHQGAIDMAQSELRYGKNEQLRRIAQEIIVEQQQEIAAMRLALGRALPPSAPTPDQPSDLGPRAAASDPVGDPIDAVATGRRHALAASR